MYPFSNSYIAYCKSEKKLSPITITKENGALKNFWNFYLSEIPHDEPNIDNVTSNDIRYFLDTLEQKYHYKKSTINKYLTYLRGYFIYLYEHRLISYYPLLSIKSRSRNFTHKIIINWEKDIDKISKLPLIHPFTVLTLIAISLGYHPNEISSLTKKDIFSRTNNTFIKDYVDNHVNRDKNGISLLFPSSTNPLSHITTNTLEQSYLKANEKHLQMPLSLYQLRISHIYGELSRKIIDKPKVLKSLRLNEKTLAYYQMVFVNYIDTEEFMVPKAIHYKLPD